VSPIQALADGDPDRLPQRQRGLQGRRVAQEHGVPGDRAYSNWLNQVERFFAFVTEDLLQRSHHNTVQQLEADIRSWSQLASLRGRWTGVHRFLRVQVLGQQRVEGVHAFRTTVADGGAHIGYVISKVGCQSRAFEAAKLSNVKLLTWSDFQDEFEQTWF